MARILYGVMGNTNGHITRSLAIAQRLPEHEFLFVGGGRVPEVIAGRYRCETVPVLRSAYRNGKLSVSHTLWNTLCCDALVPAVFTRLHRLVRQWKPDLIVTDREFYTGLYGRCFGVPTLGIDHTHVLLAGRFEFPRELRVLAGLTELNDRCLFNYAHRNVIVSFFDPPRRSGNRDVLFRCALRQVVTQVKPAAGDHLFFYVTVPQFACLLEPLSQLGRRVVVYGQTRPSGMNLPDHVEFKKPSETEFLHDLATCAFAVTNGGHNLLCEAFYFGKPVLCFPIAGAIEQFINAQALDRLGFGTYHLTHRPEVGVLREFSNRFEDYAGAIRSGFRDETPELIAHLRTAIADPTGVIK